jgi:hypothetical protein
MRKKRANNTIEMRRAMVEMLVRPTAPAIREIIRKITAYLNMIGPGSWSDGVNGASMALFRGLNRDVAKIRPAFSSESN